MDKENNQKYAQMNVQELMLFDICIQDEQRKLTPPNWMC